MSNPFFTPLLSSLPAPPLPPPPPPPPPQLSLVEIELEPSLQEQIAKRLGDHAVAADMKLAQQIVLLTQRLPGASGKDSRFKLNASSSGNTFDVCLTQVRWLTQSDVESIFALSPTHRVTSVWTEAREQRLLVRAFYECVPLEQRARERFAPLPHERRKRVQVNIDWATSGVTHADDQACLAKLLDEVYNMRDRLPVRMAAWIEPVVSKKEAAPASDDGSTSESGQTYYRANASPDSLLGFHLRVRGLPCISSAFLDHLVSQAGARRLHHYVWYSAAASTTTSGTARDSIQRACSAYGGGMGELLFKGSLATEGETELLLTIVGSTTPSATHAVELRSHPATEAPYKRALRSHQKHQKRVKQH